jgi:hypothetical protein
MVAKSRETKKLIKQLEAELVRLQTQLAEARKREGVDQYIEVRLKKKQARFVRIKRKEADDRAIGKFYVEVAITAEQAPIFVPLSLASGKKTAGFMYHIEGGSAASILKTDIQVRGDGVSQITVGTLLFAKLPTGSTATFRIQVEIEGGFGKTYALTFTRVHYKLALADVRYQQYLKEFHSGSVVFS